MHIDLKTALVMFAPAAALLALAACGGGGGSATTSTMDPGTMDPGTGQGPVITLGELTLPRRSAGWTTLQPVIRFGDELRIGAMPPPSSGDLAPAATHVAHRGRHGTVRDGVGAATLIDYLQRDATDRQTRPGTVFRFEEAPTVRYVEGTTAEESTSWCSPSSSSTGTSPRPLVSFPARDPVSRRGVFAQPATGGMA